MKLRYKKKFNAENPYMLTRITRTLVCEVNFEVMFYPYFDSSRSR